jgi:hypothetical protein
MMFLWLLAVVALVMTGLSVFLNRRQEKREAAERENTLDDYEEGTWTPMISEAKRARMLHSYRGTVTGVNSAAVAQSSGMDPLVAGILGYEIGSSLASHHDSRDDDRAVPAPADTTFEQTAFDGGRSGGAGAGSSWDPPTPSSDYSSPDPSPSYDSTPSYDSGSSYSSCDSGSSYDSGSFDSGASSCGDSSGSY